MHTDVVKLLSDLMKQRAIGTPPRKILTGYQVDGITGGLTVKDPEKNPK